MLKRVNLSASSDLQDAVKGFLLKYNFYFERNNHMTGKEKMLSGRYYNAGDKELTEGRRNARLITAQYNMTSPDDEELREELLKKLFKKCGRNVFIEPTFRCDYGSNITIGDNFYANFDCIMLDVCDVTIGNNVFLAPRVSIFTATHPIDAAIRNTLLEYGKPVTIGNDVWIGGNTVINPGVSIGNGSIIGSGSVVTKDIPSNVIAAGNPCRIIREISEEDRKKCLKLYEEYHKK